MRDLRQIEVVVQYEVASLGPDARFRQFDLNAGDEQLDIPVEPPVVALLHVGQQVNGRREAAASDVQNVVRGLQSLASQKVERPRALVRRGGALSRVFRRCLSLVVRRLARRTKCLVRRLRVQPAVFDETGVDVTVVLQLTGLEHAHAPADRLDRSARVRDEDDGASGGKKPLECGHALALKLLVADGKNFVEQENLRIEVRRNGKPQAHVHSRRVVLDRDVHEVLKPRVRHHLVVDGERLCAREAVNRRIQQHVLLAGELRMEAGAELDHAGDVCAAADAEVSARRSVDSRDQLEERALARAIPSDERQRLPIRYSQGHAAKRPELLVACPRRGPEQGQRPHLDLTGIVAQHEALREIARLDYQRHGEIVSRGSDGVLRAATDVRVPRAASDEAVILPWPLAFMGAVRRATRTEE